jgi:GTPase SAR1 family protein
LYNANGFMLVYSVTNGASLNYLQTVCSAIGRVRASLKEAHIPITLVSTKNDSEKKEVSLAEAKELATTLECPLFETIATEANDKRVQDAFLELIRQIYLVSKSKQGFLHTNFGIF